MAPPRVLTGLGFQPLTLTTEPLEMTGLGFQPLTLTTEPLEMTGLGFAPATGWSPLPPIRPPVLCTGRAELNEKSTACVCPGGLVERNGACVRQLACRSPMVPSRAGTACVCPGRLVERNGACVRQLAYRSPMVPNRAETACVCPGNTKLVGGKCARMPRCGPGFRLSGGNCVSICTLGTEWDKSRRRCMPKLR